jgi:hypothetical protein
MPTEGIYYYASRFKYLDQEFVFGGYSDGGGGFWDGTAYISGVLTVVNEIIYYPVLFTVTDGTGLYSNIKFKGEMTNWEPVDMNQDGNVWTVSLDILPGTYEWGVFEDDGSTDGIWLIEGDNLVVSVDSEGNISGDTTYYITYVGVHEPSFDLTLYPNPTFNKITVEVSEPSINTTIEIYDGFGNLIQTYDLLTNEKVIDLTPMVPGIYSFLIRHGEKQTVRQIIKL